MTIDFAPPPASVTRLYREAIEAHKRRLNAMMTVRKEPQTMTQQDYIDTYRSLGLADIADQMQRQLDEAQAARHEADRRIADFANQL